MSLYDIFGVFWYFFGYLSFCFSIFKYARIRIGYPIGIWVFLTLQYGPHTVLFPGMLEISINANNQYLNLLYSIMMGFVFVSFSFVFSVAPRSIMSGVLRGERKEYFFSEIAFLSYRRKMILLAGVLIILSAVLQKGFMITFEHLKFMVGSSFYSYTEVRRELFADSAWGKYTDIVRFSVVPIVFSYFFMLGLMSKFLMNKFIYFCFSVFLILMVSIQLNKFFFLYFTVISVLLYIYYKFFQQGFLYRSFILKMIPVSILALSVFLGAVLLLYRFQYSYALDQGLIDFSDIMETLIFRVFFASSDSLRLWIDYFGFQGEFKGLGVVGKLCFLAEECFNSNTFMPYYYMGRELTSMQAGFLGTGLGIAGWYGVPVIVMLVAGLIVLNGCVLMNVRSVYWVYICSSVMFVNSFFLTTREFHTSMMSGGSLLTSLVIVFVIRASSFR